MLVNSSQSTVRSAAQAGSEPPTAINMQAVNAPVRHAASVAPERHVFITRISLRLLDTPTRLDNFIKADMTSRSQAVTGVFELQSAWMTPATASHGPCRCLPGYIADTWLPG